MPKTIIGSTSLQRDMSFVLAGKERYGRTMSPDTKVDNITDALRQRIQAGDFGTAGRLPSLRMLAEEYSTTHETMNKVVQRLQNEGLLFSQGRAGVFVSNPKIKRIPGQTRSFNEILELQGLKPAEDDIVTPSIVESSVEVANAFHIPQKSPVVRRYRVQGEARGKKVRPYRLAENFYPVELIGDETFARMQQDIHFDALAAISSHHHKEIRQVHEDVIARLPTQQEIELLNIPHGTPVAEILRTNYADDEYREAIMYNRLIFVSHFFIFSYDYKPYWLEKD